MTDRDPAKLAMLFRCLGCASAGARSEGANAIERSTKIDVVQPSGLATWRSIAAVKSTTLGVRQDGSRWAWGNNLNGELGVGGPRYQTIPCKLESK